MFCVHETCFRVQYCPSGRPGTVLRHPRQKNRNLPERGKARDEVIHGPRDTASEFRHEWYHPASTTMVKTVRFRAEYTPADVMLPLNANLYGFSLGGTASIAIGGVGIQHTVRRHRY